MKKAQSGTKVTRTAGKPAGKKGKYSSLGGEIGRPTGPTGNRVKPTLGGAKNGGKMGKCEHGCK